MLRVEDLEKQLEKEFKYNESLMARPVGFMRKEAVEKEAEIEPVPSEEDNDDEEDQESLPSRSSDDNVPIRFSKVNRWFKCPICLRNIDKHKNNVLFHIDNFIAEEMMPPDVVKHMMTFDG
jgi:hypothetical protein